jgi:putative glycosyltransferase
MPGGAAAGEDRPALSVVTMLYHSEPYVREFHRRMVAAAEGVTSSFELIYVDDGSPDEAAGIAKELAATDARVTVVELSRNFGHHQAAVAGLQYARGVRIFIIDVDLEEQPEWLARFWQELERERADVVFGVNARRRAAGWRRYPGGAFWQLFNALSETKVPVNPCTVRLMVRRYVDALLSLPDRNLFLAGSYAWLGFKQVACLVEKTARPTRSSYSLRRMVELFLDAITSFTSYPLRLIFVAGLAISTTAVAAGVVLIIRKLANPAAISLGWPSIMVSVWFLGGTVIAFLGVIGLYLSKIFNETKGRPLYVVRDVHRRQQGA